MNAHTVRRMITGIILLLLLGIPLSQQSFEIPSLEEVIKPSAQLESSSDELDKLQVKGRAPKTGYARSEFGNGWSNDLGCDTRNRILARDLTNIQVDAECKVQSGVLQDPYTGVRILFTRGETTSDDVQIDHVVALSNAWQTGAQGLTYAERVQLANDPLNLLAVDGAANEQKSDGDAATWLPSNKSFRCEYVRRQISVKQKYRLWVTSAERDAMIRILTSCK